MEIDEDTFRHLIDNSNTIIILQLIDDYNVKNLQVSQGQCEFDYTGVQEYRTIINIWIYDVLKLCTLSVHNYNI